MEDQITHYRQRMAQHKEESLEYCLELMEMSHALLASNRKQEALEELKSYLLKDKGHAFQLLTVFNQYARSYPHPHLNPELQPVFDRIYFEGGFQGINVDKPLEAVQNMYEVHLRSNQAFSNLVLKIKSEAMDKQRASQAVEEYLASETLPFYRELAEKLLQGI